MKTELYFCKRCKIYTDPKYWDYNKYSLRPKAKCVNCGSEDPDRIVPMKANVKMMAEILRIEVYTEKGKLKHLVDDKKVEKYIMELEK